MKWANNCSILLGVFCSARCVNSNYRIVGREKEAESAFVDSFRVRCGF